MIRRSTPDKVLPAIEPFKPRVPKTSLSYEQEDKLRAAITNWRISDTRLPTFYEATIRTLPSYLPSPARSYPRLMDAAGHERIETLAKGVNA